MVKESIYKLFRYASGKESTLGLLMALESTDDLGFRVFTLEDEYRTKKVYGETRIPAGRYEIKLRAAGGMHESYTERYKFHQGMLHLQDVPDFEWIYIHPGNNDDHTAGCILVGDGVSSNRQKDGSLSNSVMAYSFLYQEITKLFALGSKVFIEIEDVS
jgi:hypothetical protein